MPRLSIFALSLFVLSLTVQDSSATALNLRAPLPPPRGINCEPGTGDCGRTCCPNDVDCTPTGVCGHKQAPPPVSTVPGNIWVGNWTPTDCVAAPGTGCTSDSVPQYTISGNDFSLGAVTLGIYRDSDGSTVWEISGVQSFDAADFKTQGARIENFETPVGVCSQGNLAWARARDQRSGLVSNSWGVWVDCGAPL